MCIADEPYESHKPAVSHRRFMNSKSTHLVTNHIIPKCSTMPKTTLRLRELKASAKSGKWEVVIFNPFVKHYEYIGVSNW